MTRELINLLKSGKNLTRKSWNNKQYLFMLNEKVYIFWFSDKEKPFIKEANQYNFSYEELFQDDWIVFE